MAILETFPNKDLDAGNGININDYEISADIMSSSDMDDVVTPLPAPTASGQRPFNYSLQEQVIGQWVNGSTLYQKTYTGVSGDVDEDIIVTELPLNVEVVDLSGIIYWDNGTYQCITSVACCIDNISASDMRIKELAASWTRRKKDTNDENRLYIKILGTAYHNQRYYLTIRYIKTNN